MEHFLINSSVCLFVLWLFYKLALENTSWHRFKRWYLLGSIVISISIPFFVVKTTIIPIEATPIMEFANSPVVTEIIEKDQFQLSWPFLFLLIYVIGVIVMLWRFIKNLQAFRILSDDQLNSYGTYQLVLRHAMTVPHSFVNRIFVSKSQYKQHLIPDIVLDHEKAHLDQKHSFDILLIELLLIVFWFNPILYLIRYSIKLNHEFLADQAVLKSGIHTTEYQETLLNYTQYSHSTALANTFNFPLIKKRFHIMKTRTSRTNLLLRSLILIPILAILIISCGQEVTQFQEIEEVVEGKETNQKVIIVDANTTDGYLEIDGEDYFYKITEDRIDIYNKYGELQDFESQGYKVSKEEIIEIEEVVEGSLNVTALEYIEENKEDLNYYLREDQITADIAIKIIKDLGQNGVEISPDHNGLMSIKIKETEQNKNLLPPPPPPAPEYEDLVKYNTWSRQINAQNKLAEESGNNEYAIVKLKDVKKFKVIYDALTTSQKKNAEPWPNFPPPPPPSKGIKQTASVKNGSWEEVEKYLKQNNTERPPQMIGDAFQVMNLNRYTLKYQFDGKSIDAGKAREILIDKGQRGVYLDTIAGEPTMIIQSKFLNTGPALPTQNPLAGDGC